MLSIFNTISTATSPRLRGTRVVSDTKSQAEKLKSNTKPNTKGLFAFMENPIHKLISPLPEPRIVAVGKTYKYRLICKPVRHAIMPSAVAGYRHFLEKASYWFNPNSKEFWKTWKTVTETELFPEKGIPNKPVSFSNIHDGTVFLQNLLQKESLIIK